MLQLTPAQFFLALFLAQVRAAAAAWCLSHRGEVCVIHGPEGTIVPLWSSRAVARRMQRRAWPELAVASVSLHALLTEVLPRAHADEVLVGVGVGEEDLAMIMVPAEWITGGLLAGSSDASPAASLN